MNARIGEYLLVLLVFAAVATSSAQHQHPQPQQQPQKEQPGKQPDRKQGQHSPQESPAGHQHPTQPAQEPPHDAHGAHSMPGDGATISMRQHSGTALGPASSPMPMLHFRAGNWMLMTHAQVFLNAVQQTGPRGGDKVFSANWIMGMAEREAGPGRLMFRTMLSFDPATVTRRRYPQLFQTGETAYSRAIVDGQHPHEFVMELSAQYSLPVGERTTLSLYAAPVGDPALGPVAFPHRASALELPQATLSHHVQDSTHIANSVVTAGVTHGMFRLEASGFHGREPDEHRWNIDTGGIDSWATRLTLSPTSNVVAQASLGRLEEPEELEEGDIVRATASLTWNRPLQGGDFWATSLIWGRNHKTANGQNINSYLLESVLRHRRLNYFTGRVELVDKDELFHGLEHGDDEPHLPHGAVFRIAAYTLGYTRDVRLIPGLQTGLGGNFTLYTMPSELRPFYGSRPAAFYAYLRIRLGSY